MNVLLEIGLEEIPARFLKPSLEDMKNYIEKELKEQRIAFENVITNGTPRRLLIEIKGLSEKQENLDEVNIGPSKNVAFDAIGQPTKACLGFAKSQNVEVSDLDIIDTGKGEYIAVKKFLEGQKTESLLPKILKSLILNLSFPKSMKWGTKKFKFVRPLRWILALVDSQVIPFEVEGIKSSNITRGHRFFGQPEFSVESIEDYYKKVKENFVIINIEERKASIVKQIEDRCVKSNEKVHIEEWLLDEVTNLVEYPYPLVGSFNTEFLEVPQEVLIISMQVHQRYFPILDENGKLLPKFVVVRNGIEESEHVVRGNETVIGARLSDARFFYNEDLKKDMEEFVESLKTVVFQKDLGTIYAKVERSKTLAEYLIKELKSDKLDSVLRTVHLAKADLMSNMIGEKEFTKLQGFMGHQYAMVAGEDKNVALGIEEHYLPRFQGDSLPTTFEGAIAGIVDKVDTLVGCFGIGMKPSGSKDPYALRRATLGIVNVLLNSKISISIKGLIENSLDIYESHGILKTSKVEVFDDIYEFFKQRIINVFTDKGYKKDIVNAVVNVNFDNLVELEHKVQTLEKVSIEPEFNEIINLLKRIENIIKDSKNSEINKELLKDEAEIALVNFAEEFNLKAQTELSNNNYEKYFKDILSGKTIINNFFESVMVMDKDEMIKNNRIAILKSLDNAFKQVADIKVID
ncbi:MAG: glycine--tRNA ligase subunit beta [Fusobacteriaceae bacterium]|nr:glycine--tRNA ligase subunit beta [Fusobacteriaceae bacterium]MBP6466720.1 glycine--tRNA ligase subunit beta [Fusobacteriaceae bacterium]MBP9595222.1 glycine--tRNA ligase subunit beta [Fusobacteriaceae bacterium]MBU9916965.1 glycine--tRNA ligase subunit beta [Fusobacteriaceae bacterium]